MEVITRYKTFDGKEFPSETAAIEHEKFIKRVEQVMSCLKARPENDGCSFANGGGYIQQDAETVRRVKSELLRLARLRHPIQTGLGPFDGIADGDVPGYSVVGRVLDECDASLFKHWCRFMCMDEQFREWGQPFYALNPTEGKQVELAVKCA